MTRRYSLRHRTSYRYQETVDLSYNEVRLVPRTMPGQRVFNFAITVIPKPVAKRQHMDAFGNQMIYFEIGQPHQEMVITTESVVLTDVVPPPNPLPAGTPWEQARDRLRESFAPEMVEGVLFTLPSAHVERSATLHDYAVKSFPKGRPVREAAADLMKRIHKDFEFDATATTVATPLSEVLEGRKGVCQDFAHLGIGCLRSMGLAARYVSGYVETVPPPGQERLIGADASHAWFSVFDPALGWLNFDPTNNVEPGPQHILVAMGRDYSDVVPVKGLMVGSGGHELDVAVDVIPEIE